MSIVVATGSPPLVVPVKAPAGESGLKAKAGPVSDQSASAPDAVAAASGVVARMSKARTGGGMPVDAAALRAAVDEANKVVQKAAPGLEFSLDKDSGRTVVRVVDSQTREVLRQIPNEDMLRMSKALDKMQGLLVRLRA